MALLPAQGQTAVTECSRHDRGQQPRRLGPPSPLTRVHTHAHTEVLSPEGLPLALDRDGKGETQTQGRRPREEGGRDWRDEAASQGTSGATGSWR